MAGRVFSPTVVADLSRLPPKQIVHWISNVGEEALAGHEWIFVAEFAGGRIPHSHHGRELLEEEAPWLEVIELASAHARRRMQSDPYEADLQIMTLRARLRRQFGPSVEERVPPLGPMFDWVRSLAICSPNEIIIIRAQPFEGIPIETMRALRRLRTALTRLEWALPVMDKCRVDEAKALLSEWGPVGELLI